MSRWVATPAPSTFSSISLNSNSFSIIAASWSTPPLPAELAAALCAAGIGGTPGAWAVVVPFSRGFFTGGLGAPLVLESLSNPLMSLLSLLSSTEILSTSSSSFTP